MEVNYTSYGAKFGLYVTCVLINSILAFIGVVTYYQEKRHCDDKFVLTLINWSGIPFLILSASCVILVVIHSNNNYKRKVNGCLFLMYELTVLLCGFFVHLSGFFVSMIALGYGHGCMLEDNVSLFIYAIIYVTAPIIITCSHYCSDPRHWKKNLSEYMEQRRIQQIEKLKQKELNRRPDHLPISDQIQKLETDESKLPDIEAGDSKRAPSIRVMVVSSPVSISGNPKQEEVTLTEIELQEALAGPVRSAATTDTSSPQPQG